MPNQLATDLRAARELISKKEDWYSGRGGTIGGKCALSAGWIIAERKFGSRFNALAKQLADQLPEGQQSVSAFNDSHKHAEVLDLFDRAIQAADQQIDLAMLTVQG